MNNAFNEIPCESLRFAIRKKAPQQPVNKLKFLFHLTQSEAAQFN